MKLLNTEYFALYQQVNPLLEVFDERAHALLAEMNEAMEERVAFLDIQDEFPLPEPAEADEDPDEALFWTERDYTGQLEVYHVHQRRHEAEGAA